MFISACSVTITSLPCLSHLIMQISAIKNVYLSPRRAWCTESISIFAFIPEIVRASSMCNGSSYFFHNQHVEICLRSLLCTGFKLREAECCLSLSKNICQNILKYVCLSQSLSLGDVIRMTVSLPINQGLETDLDHLDC